MEVDTATFITDAQNVPQWDDSVLARELPELKEWIPGLIVAGGALVRWAFPQRNVDPDSDIDLWVFDRHTLLETVRRFQVDENTLSCYRRSIIVKRPGTLLPVQIIYWKNLTPQELVYDFDIDAVRAYTDGRDVQAWQQQTVLQVNRKTIGAYRLAKMKDSRSTFPWVEKRSLPSKLLWPS